MEKITLKCENSNIRNESDIVEAIEMTFESEGMDIYDFADKLRKFTLAVGYMPGSVERVFQDY